MDREDKPNTVVHFNIQENVTDLNECEEINPFGDTEETLSKSFISSLLTKGPAVIFFSSCIFLSALSM